MKMTKWMSALILGISIVTASFSTTSVWAETVKPKSKPAQVQAVIAPVNINKATPELLAAALHGVGAKRAEAIVAYRKQHGPFKSLDQLLNIKGIGQATLAKNQGRIKLK